MPDDALRSTLRLPLNLSHYRLEQKLGAGGMGEVYLATDRRSRQRVVVKLLHEHLESIAQFQERFEREAHVAALLRSPYTVHLLDYGYERGRYFLVMDYVDGLTLRDALHGGWMEPLRAMRMATQVARALEEAQARGVVHRDIKPENIMLATNDAVKVLDFGIARQAGASSLTLPGVFVGTAAYAAPETARGEADGRSDIYSLGATLYHCLAGHPPYSGELGQVLRGHMELPLPLEPIAYLPQPVLDILVRCMAKRPEDRYQTATELAAALEQAAMYLTAGQTAVAGTMPAATVVDPNLQAQASYAAAPPPAYTPPPAQYAQPQTGYAPQQATGGAWGSQATGWPAVALELREARARRGGTSYDLVIRNTGETPAQVSVRASDPSARCNFTVPPVVAVPALGSVTVPVEVRSRRRRMGGPPESIPFTVQGESGGLPPASATATFRDAPMGKWLLIAAAAGVGLLGTGAAALAFSGGGGGDDPPIDPTAEDERSPTPRRSATPDDEDPTATETGGGAVVDTPTAEDEDPPTATPPPANTPVPPPTHTPTTVPTPTPTPLPPVADQFYITVWCAYDGQGGSACVDDGLSIDTSGVACAAAQIEVNVDFTGLRVPIELRTVWYLGGSYLTELFYTETAANSSAYAYLDNPSTGVYDVEWYGDGEFLVAGKVELYC